MNQRTAISCTCLILSAVLALSTPASAQRTRDLTVPPQARPQAQGQAAQTSPPGADPIQDSTANSYAGPASSPQAQDSVPSPQLKTNPLDTLRNFEPSEDEEYRLGKGDEIAVDFAGRPDLTAKLVIGPDGRITLPLAGDVVLVNLTRQQAAHAVEAALTPYYSNLSAQVSVTKYTANKVLLLGAVEKPGVLLFDGTPTLLEALTRGGLATGPNKTAQIPERCAIYRGHDQVVWVDLRALMNSGNALADLRLRRDDVIYVPSGLERFVSVLGQVQKPGAVPLTSTSTLASVLAEAGGFTDKAGNKPHIQIVDPSSGSSRIVSMNDILNPAKSLEITLRPGEIVFVPQSGLFRATYVLERISPIFSVATMAFFAGGIP